MLTWSHFHLDLASTPLKLSIALILASPGLQLYSVMVEKWVMTTPLFSTITELKREDHTPS